MELRDLPSTDALAHALGAQTDLPRPLVVSVCRTAVDDARARLLAGEVADPEARALGVLSDLEAARPSSVINATGVLLHTNLGRSLVPVEAADASRSVAVGSSNVELDPRTGRRAGRHDYLGPLLATVAGAEAGLAVNNNAGALLVCLASLGSGARVAVSRGELIEIGGSFRLPELMASSGATLVEVGTTNRTRRADFEAVAGDVHAILKVHPSNYRIDGFQEEASSGDLAHIARSAGIPFIYDVGSGLVDATAPWMGDRDRAWLSSEPGVAQSVSEGADLVLFSGDKLFGGPQAGIIVGTTAAVRRAATHPIARAVRLDGASIAGLASVAEMYLASRVLDIPFWAMAAQSPEEVRKRAEAVAAGIVGAVVAPGRSLAGAGSVPGGTIDTYVIELAGADEAVWSALSAPPERVIARRHVGRVAIDLRSVPPGRDDDVRAALVRALA